MPRNTSRRRFTIHALVLSVAGLASNCGGDTPVGPTQPPAARSAAAPATLPAPQPGASPLIAGFPLTPSDLVQRGWTCFEPPVVPPLTVCSHPNQGLPVVGNPPPADRPATYNLFRFDASGTLLGSVHLIRTDLYNDQLCEPTGQPYAFVPIIGYYECLHPVDR